MKKILLLACIGLFGVSVCVVSPSCSMCSGAKGPDTLKINTTKVGAGIIGYNGPTPLEISVYEGVITKIKALPNVENPRYLKLVLDSGLLQQFVGKTVQEAREMQVDAVSGATFTSEAMLENIRLGLSADEQSSK